ncbi:hypothetical protein GCM10009738_15550 [Kitasatospora viridis]
MSAGRYDSALVIEFDHPSTGARGLVAPYRRSGAPARPLPPEPPNNVNGPWARTGVRSGPTGPQKQRGVSR